MLKGKKEDIEDIIRLFDEAEEKLKDVELQDSELSIPAINQLRYAGYHLARAFCEDSPEIVNVQINKAKGHCKRAIYDAHEVGIINLLEQIRIFDEKEPSFLQFVVDVIPTYPQLLQDASEASSFIAKIKENHRDNRDSYYQECEPHHQKLREVVSTLKLSEPSIYSKSTAYIEKGKKENRRFVTTTLLTILLIVLAALRLF